MIVDKEYVDKMGYIPSDYMKKITETNIPTTGLRYNSGKLEWSLIDFPSLEDMVRVMMYGKHKYSIFQEIINEGGQVIKGSEISVEESQRRIKEGTLVLVSSGANNWKKGLNKVEVLESLIRHCMELLEAEVEGNDIKKRDLESSLPHIGHLMCNAMFYAYFDRQSKTNS